MSDQELKRDCEHYDWNSRPGSPSYPREYGARCHLKNRFFATQSDCDGCAFYRKAGKRRSAIKKALKTLAEGFMGAMTTHEIAALALLREELEQANAEVEQLHKDLDWANAQADVWKLCAFKEAELKDGFKAKLELKATRAPDPSVVAPAPQKIQEGFGPPSKRRFQGWAIRLKERLCRWVGNWEWK